MEDCSRQLRSPHLVLAPESLAMFCIHNRLLLTCFPYPDSNWLTVM